MEYKETLNWRRWTAKTLMRAYHGDFINEKIFKRWYLPETLPDVRPSAVLKNAASTAESAEFASKYAVAHRTQKRLEEERQKGLAPVGSLMMAEVERRIDVVIFRACFAHSVYEARRMVVHGSVMLNGKKVRSSSGHGVCCLNVYDPQHTNANTRLAPGDMVSVDPSAIRFLQPKAARKEKAAEEEEVTAEEAAEVAEATEEVSATEVELETEAATEKSKGSQKTPKTSTPKKERDPSTPVSTPGLTPFHLPRYAAPFMFVPAYLEPSFSTCSVIYLRHPTARPGYSEIPTPYEADGEVVRLTWEWYSKRRMRIRSKSQLARMPENRQ